MDEAREVIREMAGWDGRMELTELTFRFLDAVVGRGPSGWVSGYNCVCGRYICAR
jgi:hypothetical protein